MMHMILIVMLVKYLNKMMEKVVLMTMQISLLAKGLRSKNRKRRLFASSVGRRSRTNRACPSIKRV